MKPDQKSVFSTDRIEQAIRQRYSPFPEMSMERNAQHLNAFRIGELRPAARAWEIMMERDGELFVPASKRFADCSRLDWEVFMIEESKEAERHKATLEYFFNNLRTSSVLERDECGDVRLLISQGMTANAFKYSVHEMLLQINNASRREVTAEFLHAPVWMFESRRGRLGFLREEFALYGDPLLPGEWLPLVGAGLMRPASIAYIIRNGALGDSLLYSARFGIPGVQGLTDAQKGTKEWDDFVEAIQEFMNNWMAVTNKSAEIKLIESGKGASALPFKDLIDSSNALYSKLFRGSDLATTAMKDGVGADMQKGEKNIFVQDDAAWITNGFNERIVRPVIQYAYNTTPKAWFKLLPPKADTVDRDLKTAEFLTARGVGIRVDDACERFNWSRAEDGEDVLQAPAQPAMQPGMLDEDERFQLANADSDNAVFQAFANDLQPFLTEIDARLERILTIQDPKLRVAKFNELWAELEPLAKDILADPAAAIALEAITAKAFQSGFKTKNKR